MKHLVLFLSFSLISTVSSAIINESDIVGLTPNGSGLNNCQADALILEGAMSIVESRDSIIKKIENSDNAEEVEFLTKRLERTNRLIKTMMEPLENKRDEAYLLLNLKINPFGELPKVIETTMGSVELSSNGTGVLVIINGPDVCLFKDSKLFTPTESSTAAFLNSLLVETEL